MRFLIWKSPWGYMGAKASQKGLLCLTLPQEKEERVWEELFKDQKPGTWDESYFAPLVQDLHAYFAGQKAVFSHPLDWQDLTPFRRKVLQAVAQIPYGQVRSYKWVGESIGYRQGFRAIGQALGANPFPILIPCHRVIASDGSLGGYTGGLDYKRRLLALEGVKGKWLLQEN